jgi:hypothetical protein
MREITNLTKFGGIISLIGILMLPFTEKVSAWMMIAGFLCLIS